MTPRKLAGANTAVQSAQSGSASGRQQSTQSGTLGSSQNDAPTEHPRSSEFNVVPCYGHSIPGQAPIEVKSAARDVAAGALPRYEYLATVMNPHDPANEIIRGSARVVSSSGTSCTGYYAMNVSIRFLIQAAFGVDSEKIVGAPHWIDDDKYDVNLDFSEATLDAIKKLDPAAKQRAERAALAPFLASRLQLTVHRETKDHPVYALVVGKKGRKFQEATQPNTTGAALTVETDSQGGYVLTGRAARIDTLTVPLQKVLEHNVVDRTGLTGLYDFKLTYQPVPQHFTSMAQMKAAKLTTEAVYKQPISEAVDKQLGLKLEMANDAVELMVVDHIEKPGKN